MLWKAYSYNENLVHINGNLRSDISTWTHKKYNSCNWAFKQKQNYDVALVQCVKDIWILCFDFNLFCAKKWVEMSYNYIFVAYVAIKIYLIAKSTQGKMCYFMFHIQLLSDRLQSKTSLNHILQRSLLYSEIFLSLVTLQPILVYLKAYNWMIRGHLWSPEPTGLWSFQFNLKD